MGVRLDNSTIDGWVKAYQGIDFRPAREAADEQLQKVIDDLRRRAKADLNGDACITLANVAREYEAEFQR